MNSKGYIRHLGMQAHPEGGYFKETYRSRGMLTNDCLISGMNGERPYSTAIYFLLEQGDYSAFHRIRSDECWHFYEGDSLIIHVIDLNGQYYYTRLGRNLSKGDVFQFVVPAGCWFASEPDKDSAFSLVGCTVAPGFDFADFEMAKKKELTDFYPEQGLLLKRLCRL
jgi:predicted cupin superfamily sugar epimerase